MGSIVLLQMVAYRMLRRNIVLMRCAESADTLNACALK